MKGWSPTVRAAFVHLMLVGLLSSPVTGADEIKGSWSIQKGRQAAYVKDVEALIAEIDRKYPFFKIKGIEKGWARAKRDIPRRAARVKTDAEFIELIADVLRQLRDGHASFIEVKPKVDAPGVFYCGVALAPLVSQERKPKKGTQPKPVAAVVLWAEGSLSKVMPPGTIVTKIDGESAARVLERSAQESWAMGGFFSSPQRARFFAYRTPLSGPRGDKHVFHYRAGKKEKKVTLVNQYETRRWAHNYLQPDLTSTGKSIGYARLESGVAYVYLRRIDASVESGLRKAIDACADAKGWIVDLRGNTGGGYDSGFVAQLKRLKKPVAVIIDAGCISAGETVARDLVRHSGARLFGQTSAGSSSKKTQFALPSGLATVRFSVESRNGVRGPIEFHGIEPDEVVWCDPAELQAGRNSEIERAQEYVLGKRNKK